MAKTSQTGSSVPAAGRFARNCAVLNCGCCLQPTAVFSIEEGICESYTLAAGRGDTSADRRRFTQYVHTGASDAYNEGAAAQNQKDYGRAVKLYRKALEVNPNFPDALNNLGFSLRSIGKQYMNDAMQAYDKALALKSDHAQALEYQGELYLWRGELLKANQNYVRLKNMSSREAAELGEHIDRLLAKAKQIR